MPTITDLCIAQGLEPAASTAPIRIFQNPQAVASKEVAVAKIVSPVADSNTAFWSRLWRGSGAGTAPESTSPSENLLRDIQDRDSTSRLLAFSPGTAPERVPFNNDSVASDGESDENCNEVQSVVHRTNTYEDIFGRQCGNWDGNLDTLQEFINELYGTLSTTTDDCIADFCLDFMSRIPPYYQNMIRNRTTHFPCFFRDNVVQMLEILQMELHRRPTRESNALDYFYSLRCFTLEQFEDFCSEHHSLLLELYQPRQRAARVFLNHIHIPELAAWRDLLLSGPERLDYERVRRAAQAKVTEALAHRENQRLCKEFYQREQHEMYLWSKGYDTRLGKLPEDRGA